MKIIFYLDFSNMKSGGIYPYAKGVLSSLIAAPEIEKIYVVHVADIGTDIKDLLNNSKISLVRFYKDSKWNKIKLKFSLFLLNIYYLYSEDFKILFPKLNIFSLRTFSFRLNPLRKLINKLDADVVHLPFQFSPVFGINKPLVITVHDVQEIHFPQFFPSAERMRRALYFKIAIDETDGIVVWFNHVKDDIVTFFQKDPDAIDVAMPNVLSNWYIGVKPEEWTSLSEKYNLKKPYIFYPSATWKHKNHINLIEGLKLLKDRGIDINLYCTGSQTEFFPEIEKKVIDLRLGDRVKFLGIVPEKDLLGLYQNTELVVLPSLYEGGGIPAFEAMRLKVPIICSNIYAFAQSIKNPKFMFDPQIVASIADTIQSILFNDDVKTENLQNAKERIMYFENLNFSENFVKAYQKAINKKMINSRS